MIRFGTFLRDRRTTLNLTQRDLAQRSGVDHTYLSKIEAGKVNYPTMKTILRLERALDMDAMSLARVALEDNIEAARRDCERIKSELDANGRLEDAMIVGKLLDHLSWELDITRQVSGVVYD